MLQLGEEVVIIHCDSPTWQGLLDILDLHDAPFAFGINARRKIVGFTVSATAQDIGFLAHWSARIVALLFPAATLLP